MAEDTPLELYTKVGLKLYEFRKKNSAVLGECDALLNELGSASAALKSFVREEGKNISNDFVRVTYSPVHRHWYDPDVLLASKVKKAVVKECLVTEVNKAKFEELVEAGEIPNEVKVDAYREEEQTPKVFIKENYEKETATE